MVLRNNLI